MSYKRVVASWFTGTGTTKKIVNTIAQFIDNNYEIKDFTLPDARKEPLVFKKGDLVIFGTPVIAGRVPNVLLKYLSTIEGNGALAVPVVLFGNRNYDDALIELRDILEKSGMHTIAAGAFVGEHSFSNVLGAGRPDDKDIEETKKFAAKVKEIANGNLNINSPVKVDGNPEIGREYYKPKDKNIKPIDIRKVKPKTNDNCNQCGKCADICPMGSINHNNVSEFIGICIKCNACVKGCPKHAKYYDDEGYLYHRHSLEDMYKRRASNSVFM